MAKRKIKSLVVLISISIFFVSGLVIFLFSKFSADSIVKYQDGTISREWSVEEDNSMMSLENTILAGSDKIQLGFEQPSVEVDREISLPAQAKSDWIFQNVSNSPNTSSIAVDNSTGDIYLVTGNSRTAANSRGYLKYIIYHLDSDGKFINKIGEQYFADLDPLTQHYPIRISVGPSGNIYMVDAVSTGTNWYSNFLLYIFSPNGTLVSSQNLSNLAQSLGYHPYTGIKDVAIDSSNGTFYITFSKTDTMDRVTTDQIVQLSSSFQKLRSIDVGGRYTGGSGSFYSTAEKLTVSDKYVVSFGSSNLVVYNKTNLNKLTEKQILNIPTDYEGSFGNIAISKDESKIFFYRYINSPEDKKIRIFNTVDLSLVKEIPLNLSWYAQYTGQNFAIDPQNNTYMVDNSWEKIPTSSYAYYHKIVVKSFNGSVGAQNHLAQGKVAINNIDSGQNDTDWNSLNWSGFVPTSTSIIGCVVANNNIDQLPIIQDSDCIPSPGGLTGAPKGRYANIVFRLTTNNTLVTPMLAGLSVLYRPVGQSQIQSVSPAQNSYYGITNIQGAGFGNEEGVLKFSNIAVPSSFIISWKNEQIITRIPFNSVNGKWEVYPRNSDEVIVSANDYLIKNPIINSFSAAIESGKIVLTITGQKFMGGHNSTTGYKGGVYIGANFIPQKNILEWRDDTIKIIVPATNAFSIGKVIVMTPPQYPYISIASWNTGVIGVSAGQYDSSKVR